jgi:two-component system sensor histidine kinase KdpD
MSTHTNSPVSPDQLLKSIKHQEKSENTGHLKIFLGMAAGVGKTYAMLKEAQMLHKQGVDVQIGVIKTHGRKETAQFLEGLPIIPEKKISYKGMECSEFDIDRVLQMRPKVVLIDELAHTNVPGSRHEKRWQDVVEILSKGIDVYTTLNVQHIESLKDLVESIAGIPIKETVPDSIIELATAIELIDIPTEELLTRLKDGKVYLGEQPQIAIQHFFQKDRLTALREIALRYAAEKIDYDLLKMIPSDRPNGWKPRERLMVVVTPSPESRKLIRVARRLSFNLHAPWIALFVDNGTILDAQESVSLAKNLALARELGAEVITTNDTHIAQGIERSARQKNVTQIILGRTSHTSFLDTLLQKKSLVDELAKACTDIDIHVIRLEKESSAYKKERKLQISYPGSIQYLIACFCVIILWSLSSILGPSIGYRAVGFCFLFGTLLQGLFLSIGPLIFSSVASFLIWEFYYVPPSDSFAIISKEDAALVLLYVLITIIMVLRVHHIRTQQLLLAKREKVTLALYETLQDIAKASSLDEFLASVKQHLNDTLHGTSEIFLSYPGKRLDTSSSSFLESDNKENNLVLWVFDNGKEAGWSTQTLPESKSLCIPLKSLDTVYGVLTYRPKDPNQLLHIEEKNLLYTIGHQIIYYVQQIMTKKR